MSEIKTIPLPPEFDTPIAITCSGCGAGVTIRNSRAFELITAGGRTIMCRSCRRGNHWESYEAYLQSSQWKEKARACKKRDGNRCMLCNSSHKLHAHHRTYDRIYNEPLSDLTTLCGECHEWYETWKKSRGGEV